ncbi:MAG: hypothetical protein CL840_16165 [Crocinitomicaceae bacterium]|nr:hypothetical protein [Crocinitomicaceae bacterium]
MCNNDEPEAKLVTIRNDSLVLELVQREVLLEVLEQGLFESKKTLVERVNRFDKNKSDTLITFSSLKDTVSILKANGNLILIKFYVSDPRVKIGFLKIGSKLELNKDMVPNDFTGHVLFSGTEGLNVFNLTVGNGDLKKIKYQLDYLD